MWTRSWESNSWNLKEAKKHGGNRTLLYTTAELFNNEEFNLSHLFMLPYDNITQMMFYFSKDIHITPKEFLEMDWFDILKIMDEFNDFIEKQNGEQEDQNDMFAQQQAQMESMYRQQQNSMPKYETPQTPNFSNIAANMGNFNFPS